MTSIELTSITGSIISPYTIYACDVYGYNCVLIASISTTVPPSNTIILPSQFNTAPAVGIKIVTFDGCERFEVINCLVLPVTPTPTPTFEPTPTPTITPTFEPTPTPTITPTPTPTPPIVAAKFSANGMTWGVSSFTTLPLNSGQAVLQGMPNDVLTIQVTWPALNSMTGTTTMNSISIPENVTSTFTVTLNSSGVGEITGMTSRVGPTVYGQKLMKFTIISSSGSYPISPTSNSAVFGVGSAPNGGRSYPGSITNYSTSGTSCTNILSQVSYVTTTVNPTIGQYLYSNDMSTTINGGDNWISIWGSGAMTDFFIPTYKLSLKVSTTGLILDISTC